LAVVMRVSFGWRRFWNRDAFGTTSSAATL
jgi:hypothetical protein